MSRESRIAALESLLARIQGRLSKPRVPRAAEPTADVVTTIDEEPVPKSSPRLREEPVELEVVEEPGMQLKTPPPESGKQVVAASAEGLDLVPEPGIIAPAEPSEEVARPAAITDRPTPVPTAEAGSELSWPPEPLESRLAAPVPVLLAPPAPHAVEQAQIVPDAAARAPAPVVESPPPPPIVEAPPPAEVPVAPARAVTPLRLMIESPAMPPAPVEVFARSFRSPEHAAASVAVFIGEVKSSVPRTFGEILDHTLALGG